MSTPSKKWAPVGNDIYKAFDKVARYQPKDDNDPIGVKRVSFLSDLLGEISDEAVISLHGSKSVTPKTRPQIAQIYRKDQDLKLVTKKLLEELSTTSDEKPSALLNEILLAINNDNDLKSRLLAVMSKPESVKQVRIKFHHPKLLQHAMARSRTIPDRVDLEYRDGDVEYYWAVTQIDGVVVKFPIGHPDVQHLEDLHAKNIPITMDNLHPVREGPNSVPEVATTGTATGNDNSIAIQDSSSEDEPSTEQMTRKRKANRELRIKTDENRDNTIRKIHDKIATRRKILKKNYPSLGKHQILIRSLAWAKNHIKQVNRFKDKALRPMVLEMIWQTLFGPTQYHVKESDLPHFNDHCDSHVKGVPGCDVDHTDGLTPQAS